MGWNETGRGGNVQVEVIVIIYDFVIVCRITFLK